jgi:hypothetical protein
MASPAEIEAGIVAVQGFDGHVGELVKRVLEAALKARQGEIDAPEKRQIPESRIVEHP